MIQSDSRTAGYQQWRKLAFLHWRVPADDLQRVIPKSLTIETYDGSAWLGLVPFSMERIRPRWFPPVPGISWFLETNIRTYVVDQRGVRGVWFFSLDANKQLAVSVARTFWHLPYKMATMSLDYTEHPDKRILVDYKGRRQDSPPAEYSVSVNVRQEEPRPAPEDTLEHFLVERYILFAQDRSGQLSTGEVHHEPYRLRPVETCDVSQSLTSAMGCVLTGHTPDHAAYSDGVDVRVSPLTKVRS